MRQIIYHVNQSKLIRFIVTVFKRFFADGCMSRACALTYTSLLALVPLTLVSFFILAVFPVFASWGQSIQNFIFANFVPAAGEVIQQYLLGFVRQAGKLSIIGLVILMVTAVLMLFNIEQAFNVIWRVKRRRKGISAFLLYWALLTISPLLLGFSLALSSYIISLPLIAATVAKLGLLRLILAILPFLLALTAFTILYVAIPNCRVPFRYGLLSGLITGVLFEVAKFLFTFYLIEFHTYQILYGALAIIPVFLLWIYISWLIVLFGAVLCHALTYRLTYYSEVKLDAFTHAYLWLGYLWLGQKNFKSFSLLELITLDHCAYEVDPEKQIEALLDAKLIRRVSGGYVLGIDLHALSFWELAQRLPWKLPAQPSTNKQHPWLSNLSHFLQQVNQQKAQNNPNLTLFFT